MPQESIAQAHDAMAAVTSQPETGSREASRLKMSLLIGLVCLVIYNLNAIRTNAVVFGQRRAFAASLVLFTLAQILLLLLSLRGILPRPLSALVVLFPLQVHWSLQTLRGGLTYASVSRL